MVDSSSTDLLRELAEKRRRPLTWPWMVVAFFVLLGIGLGVGWPAWALSILTLLSIVAVYVLHQQDLLAKTVVLFYSFEPEMERAYGLLHRSAETIANCAKTWHIEAQGRVHDRKYHAGAGSLVRRKPTFVRKAPPPYLQTNIETIVIGAGRQTLHFFPDRVLVYDRNGVGAVGYRQLEITASSTKFIEEESVPGDAQVIDHTWRYVNKKGGPDKRFRNNRQLPVCLYDELTLRSSTGLNEVVQMSRSGVAVGFAQAIVKLAAALPPSP